MHQFPLSTPDVAFYTLHTWVGTHDWNIGTEHWRIATLKSTVDETHVAQRCSERLLHVLAYSSFMEITLVEKAEYAEPYV